MQTESLAEALEREHAQFWTTLDELGRKEVRIIYPLAHDLVPGAAADRPRAFLGPADLPAGWVPATARPAPQHAGG